MKEQPCSVAALIGATLLSSHKVFALLKSVPFHQAISARDLRETVYLAYLPWSARCPDHVFESNWSLLRQNRLGEGQELGLRSVLQLMSAEFLESRHHELYVTREKFGAWQQSLLSRISGLPLQALVYASWTPHRWTCDYAGSHSPSPVSDFCDSKHFPILSPHDSLVEDYVSREGLHETHLHLNGSTHAEVCWLRALRQPQKETRDFNAKWQSKNSQQAAKIRELTLAIDPELNPTELHSRLIAASQLRQWLILAATEDREPEPVDYEDLRKKSAPEPRDRRWLLSPRSSAWDELCWMQRLLKKLAGQPSRVLERMLHVYLLLQNFYYRLLVQSEEQFGFEQFQKLTFTDLREPAEKRYLARFNAMHGKHPAHSRTAYLEGRFAPKDTLKKNSQLLHAILGGYWRYLSVDKGERLPPLKDLLIGLQDAFSKKPVLNREHQRLALVAHFIKQAWSATPAYKAGPYRFYKLRIDLEHKTNVLLETVQRWPALRTWLRGVDAAANELDTPPEVFASCFRVCLRAGLTHRSYHVGEDFTHLLSGLRQMLDALELLDLRNGDRIGHGTAMGILPKLWLDRMPGTLVIKQGEWMLDLLASWRLLRELPGATKEANRVERDLIDLASKVFAENISGSQLERAMQFRHLNVRYLKDSRDPKWSAEWATLSDTWLAEARLVEQARRDNPRELELLWKWLGDPKLWAGSETLISVPSAYFDSDTYLRLQQAVMREVAERGVVIETLPSSNVRISQYHNFREHHSLRWMRVPGFVQEGDPDIMVSLGSDDPGIFAGDLNGEFYQLYSALRNHGIGDKAALDHLSIVNERGRQYRFHDRKIG